MLKSLASAHPSIEILIKSLERGRVGHAYLFSGESMDLLQDIARNFAKVLNCQNPPRKSPEGKALECCDTCPSCLRIDSQTHPDISWTRPESKSRVIVMDQVRALLQSIHLKPTMAAYKVGIIVCPDRMNEQSANAFLKTLEEPPSNSVLLLLSTEPQQIIETILSRCLRLTFGSGTREESLPEEWLVDFSALAAADPEGLLARYKLMGKVAQKLTLLREEIEKLLSAQSPLEKYDDIDAKLKEKWEDELTAAIEAEYRKKRGEVLAAIQGWCRDIYVQTCFENQDLLLLPQLKESTRKIAGRISTSMAQQNLHVMEKTQRLLKGNVQESLALEVGMLKLSL